jgi:hypothetical protein
MCSQDDHVMENTLKMALRKEIVLGGDTLFWVFLFSQK